MHDFSMSRQDEQELPMPCPASPAVSIFSVRYRNVFPCFFVLFYHSFIIIRYRLIF